ncbi:putative lipid II flippase FtsW [Amycolatopsis alkalitolerans]|uniref:Probable peptidoglycan glycosyltransferase FtsW n=1 Tax=Amycolatopsis alkalitolerans TaxID=2547244 RepID=A0A5C4LZF9_9PSEU|nr:putative lipid II flippase FtsW [Amycolatopsis alkalitolerans]TNC22646.1 putative lipid II flippase FtsW [Amycolatopsis alkalitolerans]
MTAVDDQPETGERRPRRNRRESRFGTVYTTLTAWLSRPLADFHLVLALTGLLTSIGIVMVLSASSVASVDPATGAGVYSQFKKHLVFVGTGAIVFWIALRMPIKRVRALSSVAVLICLAMLALVLTPLGAASGGAQRWFVIGGFSVQPVEFAKVALALWGAHVLVTKYQVLHQWRHLLVPVVPVALLMFALVMAQPNLSGTITLGVVLASLLWFAGAPKRLFAVLLAGGVSAAVVLALTASYRASRVLSFLSPGTGSSDAGYQALQAKYALADGGLFGKGLGQGPSKWAYLPNVQNDFIFAVIGEELGFIGCVVVIGLFVGLVIVGLRIATRNLDPWIRIVAGTLTVFTVSQAGINIGYVVGLLPVTGVTLPLISAGGTSIWVTMFLMGLLANAARHEPESVAALRSQGPGKFGRLLRLPAPEVYRPPAKRRGSGRASTPRGARPSARRTRSAQPVQRRRAAPDYGRRSTRRGTT